MKNIIILLFFIVFALDAFASGSYPSGNDVVLLKDRLRFKNTDTRIITGEISDPTSVAFDAATGSLFIRADDGALYRKTDSGLSTNWSMISSTSTISGSGTDNAITRWNGTTAIQGSGVTLDDTNTISGVDFLFSTTTDSAFGVFDSLSATNINSVDMMVATTTDVFSLMADNATITNATVDTLSATTSDLVNVEISQLTLPSVTSSLLATDASGIVGATTTQFVTGPEGATANSVAVFDGTTGKLIKDSDYGAGSSVSISSGNISANNAFFDSTIYLNQTSPLSGPLYLGICVEGGGFCTAGEVNATSTLNVDALSAGIPIAKGGTGANLTGYTGGGVVYGHPDGTQLQVSLGGTVTGQALTSVKGTRPEWFTTTSTSILIAGTSGALDSDAGFTYTSSTNTMLVDGTLNVDIFNATSSITTAGPVTADSASINTIGADVINATTSITTGTFTAATATISGIAANSFVATNAAGFLVATTTPTGGGTALSADVAIVYELQSGAAGGTFTQDADQTRVLNTEVDPNGIVTLASNQFTLGAGTYYVHAFAPAFSVNGHRAKIQNITYATPEVIGSNSYASTAGSSSSHAMVAGIISATGTETFELQHRCDVTKTSNGFGLQNSYDGNIDVFSVVSIIRIGD